MPVSHLPADRSAWGRVLCRWLPLAAVATVLCLLVYAAVQQDLRQSANDPQIQLAEDAAARLGLGQASASVVPVADPVNAATSLAPFLIAFDQQGQPLASSAVLDGMIPKPPAGVFAYVRAHGEDRLTWQPRPGVRIAAVVTRYQGLAGGFILAGRSLREVEIRESQLGLMVKLAWVAAMIASLAFALLEAMTLPLTPPASPSSRDSKGS